MPAFFALIDERNQSLNHTIHFRIMSNDDTQNYKKEPIHKGRLAQLFISI